MKITHLFKILILSSIGILLFHCSNRNSIAFTSRAFTFTYLIKIQSTDNKKLELWFPIPQSNKVQTISNLTFDTNGLDYSIKREKIHGNKYMYIHSSEGTTSPVEISINFDVDRQEHGNTKYDSVDPANYLGSYLMVPTGEIFSKIISENNLSSTNIRAIYDYVLNGMHYGIPKDATNDDQYYSGENPRTHQKWLPDNNKYGLKEVSVDDVVSLYKESKTTEGNYIFGNGNSIYACDIGVGNCTDYHSYFMSLNRTIGIPTRFHMGFSIPSKPEGKIGGYHCWSDYYIEGEEWYPVDISEADKDLNREDYYFGTVSQNRVEFMVGRDFILDNYDGGPVNLFIYPLLEVDDVKLNSFTKTFTYKDK